MIVDGPFCALAADDGDALADDDALEDALLALVPFVPPFCDPPDPELVALVRARSSPPTKDLAACDSLCATVHGFARGGELRDAVARGEASVVERAGRITGYTTGIAFFGHSVAETGDDLQALIAAAPSFGGPGFLVPSRDGALMRWCLGRGAAGHPNPDADDDGSLRRTKRGMAAVGDVLTWRARGGFDR